MSKRDGDDFRAEIESHIAHEADRLVSEEGFSPEDALAAARRTFGNVTLAQERFHESTRWVWWDQFLQDVRYAVRSWRARPGLVAVVILSLSLGIGANTAIFSAVHTLLLKDLPYRDADRLLYVTEYWPKEPVVPGPPSVDFANWRQNAKLIDGIAAYGGGAMLTLTGQGEPERVAGTAVTHGLLPLLGIQPILGRNFTEEEDRAGTASPAVMLGYAFWQRRFGGSSEVVGSRLILDGVSRTVVGVLPPRFRFPDNNFLEELLVPMALPANPNWQDPRGFRLLRVMVRSRGGAGPEAIREEFANLLRNTANQEPPQFQVMRKGMEVRVTPLRQWLTGGVRPLLLTLAGAVAMVLFIAALNIAGLQAALSVTRRKEMAMRLAAGASGSRIVRQLLTENLVLTMASGALGSALAYWGLHALRPLAPANLRLAGLIEIDWVVLGFTIAITVLSGILTGLLPAVSALRIDVNAALKEGGERDTSTHGAQRLQGFLIVAEVAAALVLVIGSGLLIRTFLRHANADAGFDARNVLTLKVSPSSRKYGQPSARVAFYRQVRQRLMAIPGSTQVAIGGGLPLIGSPGAAGVSFADRQEPPQGGRPSLPIAFVSTGYFQALGIPVLQGRVFTDADDRADAPRVAVINQAFAEKYFPGESPLGKRIEFGSREGNWSEIIGVVGNVKQNGQRPVDPYLMFGPLERSFEFESFFIVKSTVPAETLVAAATAAVHAVDPNEPVFNIATMEERLRSSLAQERYATTLMTAFAGFALLLSAIGIFGVIAYFVSQRRQEIAVRLALGATAGDIARMVLGRGMALTFAGLVVGVIGAFGLSRVIASRLEGFAGDGWTIALACGVFVLTATAACVLPARWAAAVDPVSAMRRG